MFVSCSSSLIVQIYYNDVFNEIFMSLNKELHKMRQSTSLGKCKYQIIFVVISITVCKFYVCAFEQIIHQSLKSQYQSIIVTHHYLCKIMIKYQRCHKIKLQKDCKKCKKIIKKGFISLLQNINKYPKRVDIYSYNILWFMPLSFKKLKIIAPKFISFKDNFKSPHMNVFKQFDVPRIQK